ncbi:monocarboxylate transporter 7-like [Notothenia coriiceps]|uniref:Monocarboxylate transporter 7-like n=1 Tax=Notothenia coriiceps TaxID=8208 RepID=A0A6I9P2B3_9TELE|nr:PREDICTED: monocarboxylate transporter 7-like [Notothenia coriiceps]
MRGPYFQRCLAANVYPEVPDGGWGWAVALAFFLVEVCTYGALKSLGVFLQDLMEEFGESNSRVSWVISICVFIFTFTGQSLPSHTQPCSVPSIWASGCYVPFSSSRLFAGLGYCFTFLPTVTILAQYFSTRRALVTSVASSGEPFAIFAFAPALTTLKEHIGWRYCLVVLGTFQACVIGCGLLLRPIIIDPEPVEEHHESDKEQQTVYTLENEQTRTSISSGGSQGSEDSGVNSLFTSSSDLRTAGAERQALVEWEVKDNEDKESSMSTPTIQVKEKDEGVLAKLEAGPLQRPSPSPRLLDFSVLRDTTFIWYSLFGMFATLGFFAPQLYVIELSKSRGVEPGLASYMLSVMAVAEILGRLSIGVLLSRVRCRKTLLLLGCVLLLSLVLLAFAVVWEFWGLVVCCALYGYFVGTVGSIHIPMLAEEEVVGIEKMASSVGVYLFIQSFAGLAGPPLGGVLVDVTQNYGAAFLSSAVGMALSGVCLAMVGPAKAGMCQRQRPNREEDKCTQEEDKMSQDSGQPDFLDVDPEDSSLRQTVDQNNKSVM